ncbi:MAG: zinc-ribbon domain-containing protein [Bacilli bacterium]|nr:zinc-ribbon domain-containing protein [Bacilli bacterium]
MSNLLKDNKKLMLEWDYRKNISLNPNTLTIGSNQKVWWICEKGHEWEAKVYSRTSGSECPYCTGKKRLKGLNDIFTLHANWQKYWDFETNIANNINPYSLGDKSHVKVNWICSECGKKFIRALCKTKDNVLCLECTNKNNGLTHVKTIIENRGSLLENYPNIVKEWNYKKNGNLKPVDVSANSGKKVWWVCEKGHEWEAKISNRINNDRSCPYCTNQKILTGYNDLETLYPHLVKEWNNDKNNGLKPSEVGAGSGKKYWWICKQGHEYQMSPIYRVYGMGCSICSSERKISIPEKTVLYYLQKHIKEDIIPNYRPDFLHTKEIDIYLSDSKIGVEYDGIFFHKNKKRDIEKDKICLANGIKVYHIAEDKTFNKIVDNYIYYDVKKEENLEWAINNLLNILLDNDKAYDINIKRDRIDIYNLIEYYEKEQSLSNQYPKLAKEWNYDKNGKLKPEYISYGSEKKVWWICKEGHEWEAVVHSRTKGVGCPYCAGNKVLSGYNDLETLFPEILKEWNYERNDISPSEVAAKSNKKIWWICEKGHEWQREVSGRTLNNSKCPYCANQRILSGYNDLETRNPILAKEWNYKKNNGLKPSDVFPNTKKKVWWICEKGHEWEAFIGDRNRGTGCPKCYRKRRIKNNE